MINVTMYSRSDCDLCNMALNDLNNLRASIPHQLEVIDIEDYPNLVKKYGECIPVLEVGDLQLKAPFSIQDIQVFL